MDKKLNELKSYLDYEFSSSCETGQDYKVFERKYINYLKLVCNVCGWEFVKANKNHYCFTAFIKNNQNNFVYVSISDVRWNKDWYYHVLIRTAEHSKDYKGGPNHYAALPTLQVGIDCLFQR